MSSDSGQRADDRVAGATSGPAGVPTGNGPGPAAPASVGSVAQDPWQALRRFTVARIAQGRTGVSLPTARHLDLQLAHARARDAVHAPLDVQCVETALHALGLATIGLHSAATDRTVYLHRPDLGRQLNQASRERLLAWVGSSRQASSPSARFDVAFVIADGLSPQAIERHAPPLIGRMVSLLTQRQRSIGPVAIVQQGRVAIGDQVGELMGAQAVVVLIGERPGLSSPDSLGLYLTWAPRRGLTDAARNCISNVRPEGLGYDLAARRLLWLLDEAKARGLSGVALKDETLLSGTAVASSRNFLLSAQAESEGCDPGET